MSEGPAPKAFTVALTGGIASGKSLASAAFAEKGVRIIDADVIAHELTATDTPALAAIIDHFGPTFLDAAGRLQRRALAAHIFTHPDDKQWLEALLHPMIRTAMHALASTPLAAAPYQILVIPLLAETGGKHGSGREIIDRMCVVDCTPAHQRERMRARDALDDAAIEARLAAQADRTDRLALADDILDNTQAVPTLHTQINALHHAYLERSGRATQITQTCYNSK